MYIQPVTNSYAQPNFQGEANSSKKWIKRVLQKVMDKIPEITLKDNPALRDKLQKIDSKISEPATNRLIMGATAMMTQPWIDYYNHRVDDETRTVARNRTIAKIIAGTFVGMLVRGACYKLVGNMTKLDGTGKYSKALIPKEYIPEFTKYAKKLSNHRSSLATLIAIIAMCFTNFACDAPLTTFLTNRANERSAARKEEKQKMKEVVYA